MKYLGVAVIILFVMSIVGVAYAETSNIVPAKQGVATGEMKSRPAGIKAERGVKNILFGWTEIPKSIVEVSRESKNPLWGLTAGTFKGIGKAFPRTVSGVSDVVTCPFETKGYDRALVKPDELKTQIK